MKKISVLLISIFAAVVFSVSAYAYTAVLDDIVLDYDNGIIHVSGNIGDMNSGSYVAVEIIDDAGKSVYADQITSTSKGKYNFNVKMTSAYHSGEYTVKVKGTKTPDAAVKTFSFDASKDNFYVENVVIKNGEETASQIFDTDTVSADYSFFSSFSYPMGDMSCKWQIAGEKDGIYYDLYESDKTEYAISLSDIEKVYSEHSSDFPDKKLYLRAVIKAKTTISADYSADAVSSNVVEIVTTPYIKNVRITGTPRVGNTLTGSYDYYDFQNKAERNSEYEWMTCYQANGTYKTVGKGLSYIPKTSDANMYLKLKITPKTDNGKISGESVVSDYVFVGANQVIPPSGGSGSSGGGGGGATSVAKPSAPTATAEPDDDNNNGNNNNNNNDPSEDKGFSDVTSKHWAKNDIDKAVERGIVSGTGNGKFEPEESVTRAQFSKMILGTLKQEAKKYNGEFSDISEDDWYADFVAACADMGIVSGSDGYFRPNDLIKREEMAKMVILAYRTVFTDDVFEFTESVFADSDKISDWARDFAEECAQKGFITGMPGGTFAPADYATRAQAAVVVNRLYDVLHGKEQ